MIALVLACDHPVIGPRYPTANTPFTGSSLANYTSTSECPNRSKPASSDVVLRTVAGRDGWVLLPGGRHLCPGHAAQHAAKASTS